MQSKDSPSELVLNPTIYGTASLLSGEISDAGSRSGGLYIETPKECWSYAVSFDLSALETDGRAGAIALAIAVDMEVESGWIGLGCMDAAASEFIGREVTVAVGKRLEVMVPVVDVNNAAKLMIRNVNDVNESSRFRVYGLRLLDASETTSPAPANIPPTSVSQLVGRSAGRLIPNALSLAIHEILNGASIECDQPLTMTLPQQQWAYGLLFPFQRLAFGSADWSDSIIAQLDIEVSTGSVGIATVDRTMNLTSPEQILDSGPHLAQILIHEPKQSYAIVIRKSAADDILTRVSINDIGAFRPGVECLVPRKHNLGHDLFVILAPAKTGTQTIEQTLFSLSSAAKIRRLHYATEAAIDGHHSSASVMAEILGADQKFAVSIREQADFGDTVRKEIADVRRLGGRVAFITAFREPIDRAIAATFHSLPSLLPAFDDLYAAGPEFIDLLAKGLIDAWRRELVGKAHHGMKDHLWCRCLETANYYCDEFEAIAGCDLRAHPFDHERGYVLFEHQRDTVLALRTRDMQLTLSRAISELTGRTDPKVVSVNIGGEKSTGPLYADFRGRFAMPPDLIDAIYARYKWLDYFYSSSDIDAARQRWLAPRGLD